MKRPPEWLCRRWDEKGRIPLWAQWVWRGLHFCEELDYVLSDEMPCSFCGYRGFHR